LAEADAYAIPKTSTSWWPQLQLQARRLNDSTAVVQAQKRVRQTWNWVAESAAARKIGCAVQLYWQKIQSSRAYQSMRQRGAELSLSIQALNSSEGRDRAKGDLRYLLTTLKRQSSLSAGMFWVWCQKNYWRLRLKAAAWLNREPVARDAPPATGAVTGAVAEAPPTPKRPPGGLGQVQGVSS
jgi:hypothetical protein